MESAGAYVIFVEYKRQTSMIDVHRIKWKKFILFIPSVTMAMTCIQRSSRSSGPIELIDKGVMLCTKIVHCALALCV